MTIKRLIYLVYNHFVKHHTWEEYLLKIKEMRTWGWPFGSQNWWKWISKVWNVKSNQTLLFHTFCQYLVSILTWYDCQYNKHHIDAKTSFGCHSFHKINSILNQNQKRCVDWMKAIVKLPNVAWQRYYCLFLLKVIWFITSQLNFDLDCSFPSITFTIRCAK